MLSEEQNQAFQSFATGARENDILDPKTTRLIYLAVSMAIGCYP
jgi:alkylhydroperoxidase/carboxymuconolactone decarboxylase family protein YurZ